MDFATRAPVRTPPRPPPRQGPAEYAFLQGGGAKKSDGADDATNAELGRLHRELATRLAPTQLSAFIAEEIRGSTEKLIGSMEKLDKRLGLVKEVTGVHARQFNDPTGDWKVDDSIVHFTTLTPRPAPEPSTGPDNAGAVRPGQSYTKLVLEDARRKDEERTVGVE